MTMVSNVWRILLLSGVVWSAAATPATTDRFIIDTGTPVPLPGTAWAFNTSYYFAGEFSLAEAVRVKSVKGYFSNHISRNVGMVTIAIHADGGNIPGDVLFSSTTTVPALSGLNWHGVSGLNQVLGPGTYWASFVPNSSLTGFMPGVAPNPLSEYARAVDGLYNWIDCGPNCRDSLGIGLRIAGEAVEIRRTR
jgi:hypothetical protein